MLQKRLQLFEFGDAPWLPAFLREMYHECLGFVSEVCGFYKKMHVPYKTWLQDSQATAVLDLASGNGGPIAELLLHARQREIALPKIVLSDLYPNVPVYRKLQLRYGTSLLDYQSSPLSVETSSPEFPMKSICAAFHHFPPAEARALLLRSLENGEGFFIAEPFERSVAACLSSLLIGPLIAMCTPFRSRQLVLSKLVFCTIIPIVPIMLAIDGAVSSLRMYRPDELLALLPAELRQTLRIRYGTLETNTGLPATFFYAVRRHEHANTV